MRSKFASKRSGVCLDPAAKFGFLFYKTAAASHRPTRTFYLCTLRFSLPHRLDFKYDYLYVFREEQAPPLPVSLTLHSALCILHFFALCTLHSALLCTLPPIHSSSHIQRTRQPQVGVALFFILLCKNTVLRCVFRGCAGSIPLCIKFCRRR